MNEIISSSTADASLIRNVPRLDLRAGLVAGLIGGAAEILWIALYAGTGAIEAQAVAIEVAATISPELAASRWAVFSGIAIHMALAMGIGVLFVYGLRLFRSRLSTPLQVVASGVALVAAIWALNFLVLLPQINPEFVALVPYAVALTSKLLFGIGLACGPLTRWPGRESQSSERGRS